MLSLLARLRAYVHILCAIGASVRSGVAVGVMLFVASSFSAHAMKIEVVKSPGGIEAWLVEDHSVPLMALRFVFEGGQSQDPLGKEGVSNFLAAMMDEGAGDLSAQAFQERAENLAFRMSYEDTKDSFYGNFETLSINRGPSIAMLKLALTSPRFDVDAIDRIRAQLLASLAFAARDPDKVAGNAWYAAAFKNHPYGRPANGTPETIGAVSRDDLEAYRRRVFAKNTLKIVAVGDIDAATLGPLLDEVFGGLSEQADLLPVAVTQPTTGGIEMHVDMNVPQSVAVFGMGAMARKDPDFMAAFVVNQILGGGGFASRLMEEVREKRGLAYSVYSYVQPFRHASIFAGGVATKTEAMGQSLDVIRKELERMATEGPTPEELENAKNYLTGSYALRFDSNTKIASQLLGLLQEDLGIDYIDKRNALIEAVTLDDVRRVARRLLTTRDLIVTVVGKAAPEPVKGQ